MRSSFGRVEDAKGHVVALNRLYLSTVETLATAIDAKDEVTHGHIRAGPDRRARAGQGARDFRRRRPLQAIEAAALLHDTGKIAVPEHILNKPGKLTPAEFEKMKLHAPIGAEILSAIDFPFPVVPIVRHHHENWDGTGYPDRIAGETIPIGARILSVVDCFDALTSDRPYRRRMSNADALAILLERRGTMYDPTIVDTFVQAYERIMPARESGGAPGRENARRGKDAASKPSDDRHARRIEAATSEVLAVSSLARAVSGEATIADVGALTWMMLRQVVPCASMGIFLYDESTRRAITCSMRTGACSIAARRTDDAGRGHRRLVCGESPVRAERRPRDRSRPGRFSLSPPLRSSLTVPLVHEGNVLAVSRFTRPRWKRSPTITRGC